MGARGCHSFSYVFPSRACSLLGAAFFAVLMMSKQNSVAIGVPPWWRRIVAVLVDFYFGVITIAGMSAMIELALEARRTGHFAWSFERHYSVTSDLAFGIPLLLLDMAVLILYFVFPLTQGKQTFGCFVTGIKVTPPFGLEGKFTWRGAFRRRWYEFRALGRWTSLLRPQRDADGNTWYDLESGCRVVAVDYR